MRTAKKNTLPYKNLRFDLELLFTFIIEHFAGEDRDFSSFTEHKREIIMRCTVIIRKKAKAFIEKRAKHLHRIVIISNFAV